MKYDKVETRDGLTITSGEMETTNRTKGKKKKKKVEEEGRMGTTKGARCEFGWFSDHVICMYVLKTTSRNDFPSCKELFVSFIFESNRIGELLIISKKETINKN